MHVCLPLQVAKAVNEADEAETRRAPLRDHRPLVLNQDDFLVGSGVWQTPSVFSIMQHHLMLLPLLCILLF